MGWERFGFSLCKVQAGIWCLCNLISSVLFYPIVLSLCLFNSASLYVQARTIYRKTTCHNLCHSISSEFNPFNLPSFTKSPFAHSRSRTLQSNAPSLSVRLLTICPTCVGRKFCPLRRIATQALTNRSTWSACAAGFAVTFSARKSRYSLYVLK